MDQALMHLAGHEQASARWLGVEHVIAFGYARHALTSILTALGARPGDEVILSPLTCKVVPVALLSLELQPIYADICEATLNLDAAKLGSHVRPATRAILFQHTYGNPAGIERVAALAAESAVPLIEDCAQCLPLSAGPQRPGQLGRAAIFSNNLLKPLPAGSGGMAVTGDAELSRRITHLRDELPRPGRLWDVGHRTEAWIHKNVLRPSLYWTFYKLHRRFRSGKDSDSVESQIAADMTRRAYRPSAQQLREGTRWLLKLESIAAHRRLCCKAYARALNGRPELTPAAVSNDQPLCYFPVLAERKTVLLEKAQRQRIELIAWPIRTPIYPVEEEGALAAYGYQSGSCPVAEQVARRLVGLPTDLSIGPRHRRSTIKLVKDHHEAA